MYKTLQVFEEMDEVLELGFSDDDNRYDGYRPYPQPHLICIRSRTILDPDIGLASDLVQQVTRESGFRIVGHRLYFYGLCPQCQTGGQDRTTAVPAGPHAQ